MDNMKLETLKDKFREVCSNDVRFIESVPSRKELRGIWGGFGPIMKESLAGHVRFSNDTFPVDEIVDLIKGDLNEYCTKLVDKTDVTDVHFTGDLDIEIIDDDLKFEIMYRFYIVVDSDLIL